MGEYDSKLDECMKLFPAPKQHRVNMEGYLRSYLYTPALHLLSVARAKQMVEAHCGPEESQEANLRRSVGGHREVMGKEATSNSREGQTNTQKVKTDIWSKTKDTCTEPDSVPYKTIYTNYSPTCVACTFLYNLFPFFNHTIYI